MLERLGLALLIAGVGLAAYFGWTRFWLARKARETLGIPDYRAGRPAILYFTAPGCLPCQTVQRPALNELLARWGGQLQVLEVDALAHPDLADSWGVLAVPTTFVIDWRGRPRRMNHGVARLDRLSAQLAEIGETAPAPIPTADREPEGARSVAPTEDGTV
ncbi:MAG: thioredoxin family protein, partial [Anaerolineales bacterium]